MKPGQAWRRYLRFWGADPEGDVDDEFRFHIETRIDELRSRGLSARAARREALRQFGPLAARRAECVGISRSRVRRASWIDYWTGCAGDVRYALRTLRQAKASTAAAVLILAVGIGATTAVFTVMDRLLYSPLPVPRPSELALVWHHPPGPRNEHIGVTFNLAGFEYLRDHQTVFAGLAAESVINARERHAHQRIETPARAVLVSANFFDVLGVQPWAGRVLAAAGDTPNRALAGYRFASRRYEQPADAVGQTVYLNDIPFTIVGVMPPGFYGTYKGEDPDLYVPLSCAAEALGGTELDRGAYLRTIGRLRSGVDRARAQSELQVLWRQFLSLGTTRDGKDDRIACETGMSGYAGTGGDRKRSLTLLGAIVALLLAIGCGNVACLLLARGAARRHEMGIRLALGAGRLRILRQSAVESGLLALAGGGGALVVSEWSTRLLLAAFHWQAKPIAVAPDMRVVAFASALTLVSAVVFGLAPALQLLRAGMALHGSQTPARAASGKALVVMEVALSLVLVAGAAVFARSLRNLHAVPTGFSADHVSVVRLARNTDDEAGTPVREAEALADSLQTTRGVRAVGLSNMLSFNDGYVMSSARSLDNPRQASIRLLMVGGGYFETLRIPLLAGRAFTKRDDAHAARVAVLNESLARKLFPDRDPLGKLILVARAAVEHKPGDETRVVGIVKDTKFTSLAKPDPDIVYLPLGQFDPHSAGVVLEVHSLVDAAAVGAMAAARIRDARLPLMVRSSTALGDEISATLEDDSIRMQASGIFGILALTLIGSGLYGLMAYTVARRTREIGVRMAMGSTGGSIVAMVVRQSLTLVALGIAIGIPGTVSAMKAVSGLVFALPAVDYVSLAIAAALLGAAGLAASAVPAWRAAHVDPMNALRVE